MEQLQALISKISNLNAFDIRQIRFRYPQKGLLQAYRQVKGEELGEKLLQAVAKECKIDVLPGEKLQIDTALFSNLSDEIFRLALAFKAVPMSVQNAAQGEVLLVAVCDPLDEAPRRVFHTLFNKAILPVLVREEEFEESLRFYFPDHNAHSKVMRAITAPENETKHIHDALKQILEQIITTDGKELHFELVGEKINALMKQNFDREIPLETSLTPQELVAGVLSRGRLQMESEGVITGTSHLAMLPIGIDFAFRYEPTHRSTQGEKGRKLILSDFTVKERKDPVFWSSPAASASKKFAETLLAQPGLYIGAFPQIEQQRSALAALQQLSPDIYVVKQVQDLAADPNMINRLKYSRVLLPLKANGVLQLIKFLGKAPAALRGLLRGLFCYAELDRPCPFCRAAVSATPATLSLLPEHLHSKLQKLQYPCGCPVCQSKGYLGKHSVLSFAGMDGAFGEAFKSEKPMAELAPLLQSEGWIAIAEIALEEALKGNCTIESIAALFLGKSPQSLQPLAGNFDTALTPLAECPIRNQGPKPTSQVEFHSVVLEAKDELLAAREALLKGEDNSVFETHEAPSANKNPEPKNTDSGHQFHSVVLDMGDDLAAMRAKLLEEDE